MSASNTSDSGSDRSRATVTACGATRPASASGLRLACALLALPVLACASCTAVPAFRQQRLAKANMVFDDTNAFAFSTRLLPQSEPGSASSGGAQGGGCTACK